MSGTSLDGLDIAYCNYIKNTVNQWEYTIIKCETIEIPKKITEEVNAIFELSANQFVQLDIAIGNFIAKAVNDFIAKNKLNVSEIDAIASHGQTVFHQPQKGYTSQIGNPGLIAVKTGIQTIGDFRSKDVFHDGQGAPLVPIGDQLLFGNRADAFINIGGFCNISYLKDSIVHAFDVCPGNLPLNKLAQNKGLNYDKNGTLARSGNVNFFLLDLLNKLSFYQQNSPKSLGTEWLENTFYPLLKFDKDIESNLATLVEHIASQLVTILEKEELESVIITGGGAKNSFLMERIQHYYKGKIEQVTEQEIDFKEAIVFGLLGALRLEGDVNCLASVTGASKDVCGGVIFEP